MRILFIAPEISPYLPDSEIGMICRHLPQGTQECGKEIRTFMPKYGCINERRNQLHEVIRLSGMNLIIDDSDHPLIIKVASIQAARMQVYFIDNDDYFNRKSTIQDEAGNEEPDNDERAVFFSRGVLETVKKLRWSPNLIHVHGWFGALVALYIKKSYADEPLFKNTKVVLSLYDDGFKNPFRDNLIKKIKMKGIKENDLKPYIVAKQDTDYNSFIKLAIHYADGVIQGTETVDPELLSFIAEKEKPFLKYQPQETLVSAYNAFYDNFAPKK